MRANLGELLDVYVNKFEELLKFIPDVNISYEFETKFNSLLKELGQIIYQGMIEKVAKSKNDRTTYFV